MREFYKKLKAKLRKVSVSLAVPFLIALFVAAYFLQNIVIIIPAGHGGVFWSLFFGGTQVDHVYAEGVHFIYPWDKMYDYNVRVQEVFHEFDVLTKNGLKVHLFISIRYQPQYKLLGLLHKKVGPDYVNVVVIPEIENVLRVLIGKLDAEEVYRTEQAIIEKSISEAVEQIAQRYVNVDDVIIKKMQLPASVEQSIREKIQQKHIADSYKFRLEREEQEKERKRIEAEGLKIFNKSLSPQVLHWMGIDATLKLAESENAKTVVIGGGKQGGLPIIGGIPIGSFTDFVQPQPSGDTDSSGKEETSEPETSDVSSANQISEDSGGTKEANAEKEKSDKIQRGL
ncbi:prohibitin family protein [Desulfonema magnum]|uniref:SPFH domain-containing protein n=1 Tax=Desulfonema magnum TaxID=45655 RepID=A0A975BLR1_9BACT|nr:prohibitin family protein [Desulfonema magnum]QTA87803.1 SPFH domain-containing protein [Desulfonema magnum]